MLNKKIIKAVAELHEKVNPKSPELTARIIKNEDTDQRLFYAVVLEPMTNVTSEGDAHGDRMTSEEIEKSAHYYMEMGSTVFKNHQAKIDAKVVESFIAPISYTPEGSGEQIKQGSWVMAVKIFDDDMWKKVKSGEITAFSPGGFGNREDLF